MKPASKLKPGDTYIHPGTFTTVTILSRPRVEMDFFGRDELKVWARREDTGDEDYLRYGIGAEVPL